MQYESTLPQTPMALENLKTILASQGADFSNIVKTNIFTTDMERYFETGKIRREYFAGHAPGIPGGNRGNRYSAGLKFSEL